MSTLVTEIEKAFDYRGDVTLKLKGNQSLVGFVFSREVRGSSRCPEPFLEVMIEGTTEKRLIKYSEIESISFTGEDTAAGKSWEDWLAKQEAKKKAVSVG